MDYVVIECPECTGSLPHALDGTIHPVNEAACLHCGSQVRYVVTHPANHDILRRFMSSLERRHTAPTPAPQPNLKLAS